LKDFPQAETWLAAFGISDVAQISSARALFGEIPVRGKLPVTIPGVNLKAGFGMELQANPMALQSMMRPASAPAAGLYVIEKSDCEQGVPGGNPGGVLWRKKFRARVRKIELRGPVPATVSGNDVRHRFADESGGDDNAGGEISGGRFCRSADLDAKIERYLPEWTSGPNAEWRHRVTVRHLLTHTSGLPPFKEYWRTSKNKQDTLTRFLRSRWSTSRGRKKCIRTWELS